MSGSLAYMDSPMWVVTETSPLPTCSRATPGRTGNRHPTLHVLAGGQRRDIDVLNNGKPTCQQRVE